MRELGAMLLYGLMAMAGGLAGAGALWLVLAGGAVVIGAVAGASTAIAFYILLLRPQRLALEQRVRALEALLNGPCRHCGKSASDVAIDADRMVS